MPHFRKKSSSSSTPTNSRPSTPTSLTEYIKKGLATFFPRDKTTRALVASSSAIASSTVSASCNPSDVASDEPGSSKESVWKTAYGAANIAVETAEESSNMFPPLKAVAGALSVLIRNYDQNIANAEQVKNIDERVESLSEILTYPVGDQDTGEKARRAALKKLVFPPQSCANALLTQLVPCRTLSGIIAKLEPLSKQRGLVKFLNNVDHATTLNGFVQDLSNAVTDYQTSTQRNIYDNAKRTDASTVVMTIGGSTKKAGEITQRIIEDEDMKSLGMLNPVDNAGYQAGHHNMCLRGTRDSALDEIMRWAKDPQERHVFWLNGLAGTGKSTIAQTFSKMVAEDGTLGASFFCSRDCLNRRELKNIFPTIAYQLACRHPSFRNRIIRTIKNDPSIASASLVSQLDDLIIDPLSSTDISCVIVIDALDECIDDQPASALLSVLGRCVKDLPFVKIFITGRPETRIHKGFRLPLLEPLTQIFLLHGIELANEDIRLYLQEKLNVTAKRSDLDLPNPCVGKHGSRAEGHGSF